MVCNYVYVFSCILCNDLWDVTDESSFSSGYCHLGNDDGEVMAVSDKSGIRAPLVTSKVTWESLAGSAQQELN